MNGKIIRDKLRCGDLFSRNDQKGIDSGLCIDNPQK